MVSTRFPIQAPAPNIMYWICFPIPAAQGCMLAIPWVILPVIYSAGIKGLRDSMFCIQWAMILLGSLPSSTPLNMAFPRPFQQNRISGTSGRSWIKLVFVTIGTGKFGPVMQIITAGRNGYSFNFSGAGSIVKRTLQKASPTLEQIFRSNG